MNKFSWYEAKSVEDALEQVSSTVSEELYQHTNNASVLKSGGIDVFDWVKEGLLQPEKIVNIRNIPGLDKISFDKKKGFEHRIQCDLGGNCVKSRNKEQLFGTPSSSEPCCHSPIAKYFNLGR